MRVYGLGLNILELFPEAMSPAEEIHCMLTSSENALLEESLRG